MPIYEFRCEACNRRDEVFARSVTATLAPPLCAAKGCRRGGQPMVRALSKFARHLTEGDKLAEAEATWGKEVDGAMGPMPDIGRMARRYGRLAKDLPPPDNPKLV